MRERRGPGWDAQAINRIAEEQYGGLTGLFESHDWPERGASMMPAQQRRVVETYGNVENFVYAHDADARMSLHDAIKRDPPNVWLTSLWGFQPDKWGCITFPDESALKNFLRRSEPGALMVVYDTGHRNPHLRRKVRGFLRSTHIVARTQDLLTPDAWSEKQSDPEMKDRWPYAVRIDAAWAITSETQPTVDEFADISYWPDKGRAIGRFGVQLKRTEASKLLALDFYEVPIANLSSTQSAIPIAGRSLFSPSRAGPVSQNPHVVREAEGPKHLYILTLTGDTDAFLGWAAGGSSIVKVGFSRSPATRCEDHNRALPRGAYSWIVHKSTFDEGRQPFPSSGHAKAGEKAMKESLAVSGSSLGGEFFLAGRDEIHAAWRKALETAERWGAR